MSTFDITGPLPTGTTLLEASAGTGKTWTIGALVTRFVAEGEALLEQMLVVTFGRAASQELRERVRSQLVAAEAALADPSSVCDPDDLIGLLLDADEAELDLRHARIRQALVSFDAATIATTHQFCSMVLDSLGVAGDSDTRTTLVEDLSELTDEVVDDLYLRAFAYRDEPPLFTRAVAGEIARSVVTDPQARIEPATATPDSPAGRRVGFAEAVRTELDRRKRLRGILSYDDLLTQLARALDRDDSPARARMRGRWKIVLVDEFQDTDPVQWQVLDRAFSGHARMVLIGDPKQAIYAFRGGDVATYLDAKGTAATTQSLGVNWRCDRPLLKSLQAMLHGAQLGDEEIAVHEVDAHHAEGRLVGAPEQAPLRLRVVRRAELGRRGSKPLSMAEVRPYVAEDLAADIRRLLAARPTFDGRPLEAGDVAVIAYRHGDLAAARDALHAVGIPAVIAGGGSVFATPAALEWLTLLEAVEQPHRVPRVRAAALTPFLGETAAGLVAGGDQLTDRIAARLRDWAEIFALRGVAALMESASADGLAARVLGRVDGERHLTDLRHLGEALHETALRDRLGVVALTAWLRDQIAEADTPGRTDRTRRLDSDAAAVQLVTIHASKGLEYPVVYLPSLADRFVRAPELPLFHDDDGRRCRYVGGPDGDGFSHAVRRAQEEEAGEWLRLLYVAMTRAQSQVVAWWAPSRNAPASPLHRMLLGRGPGEPVVPTTVPTGPDDDAVAAFTRWRDVGGPSPEVARPAPPGAEPPAAPVPDLEVRTFTRAIDADWRRTSYSGLTTATHHRDPVEVGVSSEPEETPRDDEVDLVTDAEASPESPQSPMSRLPVGATFGSLVHAVLEHTDPDASERGGDLVAELRHHLTEQLVRWPVELDQDALVAALVAVCDTPLGPLTGDLTLRRLPLADRLAELEFELPLDGGDDRSRVTGEVRLGDLAELLRRHLPEGDPVRPYAERLDHPALGDQPLRGYLTGFIDLTLRVDGRYFVCDYKTNWLGAGSPADPDFVLRAHDYAPPALIEAMGHSDYPLQALLYSLVLHRYLRWREPDYDPARHLGGVLYLYLRGMCGPETPVVDGHPCGVFSWRPPASLVTALSDLVDGRTRP
ncbi:UvrD-helicase domain-containing protein [Nocardioides sp.]|uniref:UvrD-helicase domain-containing protein n=1 Tax=Nocardioides sp. TaxID=35761 RepID=UPI002ED2623F